MPENSKHPISNLSKATQMKSFKATVTDILQAISHHIKLSIEKLTNPAEVERHPSS